MTKLESIEHKIFASEAPLDEIGQFGSALDTTKLNTKDVTTIQALPAYTKGWGSAVISDNNYPTMEEMNGVLNVMSYHTGYLYQEGMPAWRSDREYSATSIVKEPTGTKFFHSLKDGNIGNTLDNTEWWEELKLGGGGLEVCDIGMALYVDETKGLRRYLNGQIVDINTNTQAFLNRLKEITTLHPSLLCTEEEWQTAKTMSVFGQVGKFVFNYNGADIVSVRLPRVVNVQGLFDLQKLGMAVSAGLPNITGEVSPVSGTYARVTEGTGAFKSTTPSGTNGYQGGPASLPFNSVKFNASDSNPIYGNSTTVQPESIQYPYFIQIATGSETENNIINEIELNNPYSLFDSKYSDHELNNLSWLKSEGQWNAKAVYPTAYDKLLKVYNGTETVAGLSVKLSTETYTDYDFVLNTADETFRLPLKTKLASGKAVVGNGMTLGLTNGTDNLGISQANSSNLNYSMSGGTNVYGKPVGTTATGVDVTKVSVSLGLTTDPTKSGLELSDSGLYLYFYVGETVQNANLIDAGRIGEQLATKTDMLQASGAGMPSNKYIDLTLGASGSSYTAPANGYYYISGIATANNGWFDYSVNSPIKNYYGENPINNVGGNVKGFINVKKGSTILIVYANLRDIVFRFIYAEGSK